MERLLKTLCNMSSREIMDSKNGMLDKDIYSSKRVLFRDPVVENVCDKFIRRSDIGYEKYGRTLHDERTGRHKDLLGYLNDIQEELMDAILYIQTAREEMIEQIENQRMKIISQNGNSGEHYDNTPDADY
tara:strand:+ start:187 stop:576 length:390 start_codon:yes stop_codon:yes gene_type:complete